jgi:hypothetical protein
MRTFKNTKFLLASLLIFLTGSVWAAVWDNLGVTQDGVWVIDHSTIRKDALNRKVWIAVNLFKAGDFGAMSIRSKVEINCKDERIRELSIDYFSKTLITGDILYSLTPQAPWSEIPPDSIYWKLLKVVCAK